MLLELRLKDFVLIPEARLSFAPGLIVLTGETGAGKSLLVQSLKLLLGGRGGAHLIRPGAQEAVLEAVISGKPLAQKLEALGLSGQEEVVLRRVVTPERSRIYINGSPATAQMLARLTEGFIVLAGQHEYQTLNHPEERLKFLDAFARHTPLVEAYREAYQRYQECLLAYRDFVEKMRHALKEKDFLAFQIQEIEEVAPQPGEDEALEQEARRLRSLSKLRDLLSQGSSEMDQVLEGLSRVRRLVGEAERLDQALKQTWERLEGLYYEAEDLHAELAQYLAGLEGDERRLEEIEERLYKLRRLKRKYASDLSGVLEELERMKRELASLEVGEERLAELEADLAQAQETLLARAQELSLSRQEAARALTQEIQRLLGALALGGSRFQVEVRRLPEPGALGFDRVEFMVSTNPKSPLRPLTQVASGGELSRFFLALKTVVSQDQTPVLVFDEIDVGVGGRVAHQIGKLLKDLAQRQQVICVTHLPQIAAQADQHFVVEKLQSEEEVTTHIKPLDQEGRLHELARMLGGSEALELAQKLLVS